MDNLFELSVWFVWSEDIQILSGDLAIFNLEFITSTQGGILIIVRVEFFSLCNKQEGGQQKMFQKVKMCGINKQAFRKFPQKINAHLLLLQT